MHEKRNPKWWNRENDSTWERIKAAFKRDWDQTKHDLGGRQPDTDQDVDDTVKQAAGKQSIPPRGMPVPEDVEDANRFGFGARTHYGARYSAWNSNLESELQRDWRDTYNDRDWARYRDEVRRGWDYQDNPEYRKAA